MKSQVVEFSVCDARIGYQMRKVTLGPEHDLVKSFLQSGLDGKGYSFSSKQLAIFVEPRLDSGFPDIVLAEFKQGFYDNWRDARNELRSDELRMLSYLHSVKGANLKQLREGMRISALSAERSLELLFDADLVDRNRDTRCWSPRPIGQTFGIKRLVALEAKVCNNDDVLAQASLNRWFASESWALTPVLPKQDFLARARRAGVGMVAAPDGQMFQKCAAPKTFSLPASYASWQFNEWIGRKITKE